MSEWTRVDHRKPEQLKNIVIYPGEENQPVTGFYCFGLFVNMNGEEVNATHYLALPENPTEDN